MRALHFHDIDSRIERNAIGLEKGDIAKQSSASSHVRHQETASTPPGFPLEPVKLDCAGNGQVTKYADYLKIRKYQVGLYCASRSVWRRTMRSRRFWWSIHWPKRCGRVSVLSTIGGDVEYLIEKGSISKPSSLISELRVFQAEPMNGSSVGSDSTDSDWGSLGGYLRLKDGNFVAMTCGHVIARDGKLDPTILCVQPSIYHLKNQDNGTEISSEKSTSDN